MATTFWVGEIHDPNAHDGSQMISAYDGWWYERYGGCDGVVEDGVCNTEVREAANNYFPKHMTPQQNPFYLDLPFNDVTNEKAFSQRHLIPWANDFGYAGNLENKNFSYMKNRWVELSFRGKTCFARSPMRALSSTTTLSTFRGEQRTPEEHRVQRGRNGCFPGSRWMPGLRCAERNPGRGLVAVRR
ncbi:hypothetical protein [Arthrobacter sp. JCM 19049]|uniref:hypothetical protein n=1 Tax=Arthrobacter sp. JCM 19049 TaxID=1460643 RepID=UPI0024372B97|nr:hypothetical protein [Arthrobacter sp. JCM 19049]